MRYLIISVMLAAGLSAAAQEKAAMQSSNHPAAWLADGSYGVMTHYLLSPAGDTEAARTAELNRIVDGFDLDFFINQFKETGADWLIFTIGQNTGYYVSPNTWLDKNLPGRTSRRDLVKEIGERVNALGKRLIVYLPVEVAGQKDDVRNAFGWNPADQTTFLSRYLEFVKAYSMSYGSLASGWWFDGCYPSVHEGKWDWAAWIAASKAGNPASIVALSDATFCVGLTKPLTPLQDYLGGEVHLLEDGQIRMDFVSGGAVRDAQGRLRVPGQEAKLYLPDSQFSEGVQWHALVPIDSTFNPAVPDMHYPDAELFGFVKRCKSVKGAVTLNAPIGNDGHIPAATAAQLKRLGEALKK